MFCSGSEPRRACKPEFHPGYLVWRSSDPVLRVTGFREATRQSLSILWPPKNRHTGQSTQEESRQTMPAKNSSSDSICRDPHCAHDSSGAAQSPTRRAAKQPPTGCNCWKIAKKSGSSWWLRPDAGPEGFSGLCRPLFKGGGVCDGRSMGAVKGPAAISKSMEDVFRRNPTNLREPNFHLFAMRSSKLGTMKPRP